MSAPTRPRCSERRDGCLGEQLACEAPSEGTYKRDDGTEAYICGACWLRVDAETATPGRPALDPQQLAALREHMATRPAAPPIDPDPEVNVKAFDEGCAFDDWAEIVLDAKRKAGPS